MPVSSSTSLRAFTIANSALGLVLLLTLPNACARKAPPAPAAQGPSAKEIEARLLRISEAALAAKKYSGLTARGWESLGAMLPASLGQLHATGAATGHLDSAATKTSKATRRYASTSQTAKIEVLDVVEANGVLLAFMLQQAAAEGHHGQPAQAASEPFSVSLAVGPHPALARYTPATRESIITIAVAKRFLIELTLTPSSGTGEALGIARTLPLGAFAAVSGVDAPDADPTAITSAAVEGTVVAQ